MPASGEGQGCLRDSRGLQALSTLRTMARGSCLASSVNNSLCPARTDCCHELAGGVGTDCAVAKGNSRLARCRRLHGVGSGRPTSQFAVETFGTQQRSCQCI